MFLSKALKHINPCLAMRGYKWVNSFELIYRSHVVIKKITHGGSIKQKGCFRALTIRLIEKIVAAPCFHIVQKDNIRADHDRNRAYPL